MKGKIIIFSIMLLIYPYFNYGQELFQKGKGSHIEASHFTIGSSVDGGSIFDLGVIFRHRLSDKFDAGLLVDYRSVTCGNNIPKGFQSLQGKGLTIGPVFGYTSVLSNPRWGIRSSLSLRITLSSITQASESRRMALAGYGMDIDIFIFRHINLGKSINAFPGIGLFASITHFTGHNRDEYGLSRIYVPQKRQTYFESAGTPLVSGLLFKVPVSFKVFRNKRLALEPSYWFDSYNSVNGLNGLFRINIRFSF